MFNNTQSNQKDRKTVNTNSFQFFNKDGFDPSTVIFGFWKENFFSIKIHPAKDKEKQTETDVFDYDKVINTALVVTNANVLLNGAKKKVLPALEEGIAGKVAGVVVSGNNIVTVGTKDVDGKVVAYLAIHKGLNESRIPEMSCYYEFKSGEMISDYDETTGNFDKEEFPTEFHMFITVLEEGLRAMTNATAHSMRVVDNYARRKNTEKIDAIMSGMGIQQPSGGGGKRFSKPFANSGNNGSSSGDDNLPGIPTDNISSLEGF